MKIVDHPYLAGVRCREDGAIFIPASRSTKAHWTFGTANKGYRSVGIHGKYHSVHRLMAEAFLRCPIPDGMQIDHIDHCRSNNKLENIRIVTPSENLCNRAVYARCGVSTAKDINAYYRTRYATDPEHRRRVLERNRAWRAKKKVTGESLRQSSV